MNCKPLGKWLALFLGMSAFTACLGKSNDVNVIGVLYPRTGQKASIGERVLAGFQLAELNLKQKDTESGKRIRLVLLDTEGSPAVARAAYRLAARKYGARAVVGSVLSSDVKGFLPEIEKLGVPVLANGASAPDLRGVSPIFFRNWPTDDYEGRVMAEYAFKDLGLKRAFALAADDDYPRGLLAAFSDRFKELGGDLVAEELYEPGATNYDALIRSLSSADADFLYIVGYAEELGLGIKALRSLDPDLPVLSAVGIDAPEFYRLAGAAAHNIFYTAPVVARGEKEYIEFRQAFEALHGREPDTPAAIAYDAIMIVAQACRNTSCRPDEIAAYLREMKPYQGASGLTSFDEKGDVQKPIAIKRIDEGVAYVIRDFSGKS